MITTQPNLFARRDQEAAQKLTAAFLEALADTRWHLRRDLVKSISGLTERSARIIAEHSHGAVIGSIKGYKLVQYATAEEYQHWENAQRSQARKTLQRVVRTRNCFNRGGRAVA
jgi:hypothetical protein